MSILTKNKIPIIGVMGPGTSATKSEIEYAEEVGRLIASNGWRILTGGSSTGVMNAALKGAKKYNPNCVTIGILSNRGEKSKVSKYADIVVPTGMGEGRNNLNILSSHFIIFCCNNLWSSPGTFSEAVFTIKHKRPFIALHEKESTGIYQSTYHIFLTPFPEEYKHDKQEIVDEPQKAIQLISFWLKTN